MTFQKRVSQLSKNLVVYLVLINLVYSNRSMKQVILKKICFQKPSLVISVLKQFSIRTGKQGIEYNLPEQFISSYQNIKPNFGFNGLGEMVYKRTYSRQKEDGTNEEWFETIKRVVEGTFSMKLRYLEEKGKSIDSTFEFEIDNDAKIMYDKIFNFKFLPPGRGLWAMGSQITETKKIYAALNNCAFVSTKPKSRNIEDIVKPYLFLMDSSMLGIGVGFDTKASNCNIKVYSPLSTLKREFVVEDSREGWVYSVEVLLKSFFEEGQSTPVFNYTQIRPAGSKLSIFGGVSSGYKALEELHTNLKNALVKYEGKLVDSRLVVDLMNLIGKSVVAGNIRRSAEIALGDAQDSVFVDLKNYVKNPDRIEYGWVSNNSVYCNLGMDYEQIAQRVISNGEPGFLWLDNMKTYSRMVDYPDNKDFNAEGGNPCLEQTLESYEMCCLVETFPNHHNELSEYLDTLKYAFMYAKIVTLGMTGWKETNDIIVKNRRIGVSVTGIAQFINRFGLDNLRIWLISGYDFLKSYDSEISKKLDINQSIKITSVKPSGTVSLLGGATPGLHLPHSRFYVRRVRIKKDSPILEELTLKGFPIEPEVYSPETTMVVSFPIDIGKGVKTIKESNLWEQLSLAAFFQKYWADNQVSCTVSFRRKEEGAHVASALDFFQYQLKGISFLPLEENNNPYPQMPYEEITEEKYLELISKIKTDTKVKKLVMKDEELDKESDKFCDSDKCLI